MSNKKIDERDDLKRKTAQRDIEGETEGTESDEPEQASSVDPPKKKEDSKDKDPDKKAKAKESIVKEPEQEALQVQYLRLQADYQNLKKRTEKEKSDIYAFANEKLSGELLNVIDNFERAMAHIEDSNDKNLANGMIMIFKQLKEVLEKNGIKEIDAQGEMFDPNCHHAVLTSENDEVESGRVIETLQKGYTLKGKVIRPAMVKVAE
jgi:molecular chaperone GrpE